ncbi:MAG: hypothetical protein Q9207_001967 [Kuettlingeria erythrocarpa]
MYISTVFLASLLALTIDATPVLIAKPIPDDQMQRIKELDQRSLRSKPIPEDTLATLKSFGRRSEDLDRRDSRLNCQKRVQGGTTQHDIAKVWVPVGNLNTLADQFCRDATGTDIALNHEVSDTYGTKLTNQDDATQTGGDGNIVFSIFNLYHTKGTYIVDHDSCLDAMKKQTNDDSTCYGKEHGDTRGGYWTVDSVGLFGAEIYIGVPSGK